MVSVPMCELLSGACFLRAMCLCGCVSLSSILCGSVEGGVSPYASLCWVHMLGLHWCECECTPEGTMTLLSPWEQSGAQGRGDTPSLSSVFSWEPAHQ
jgi:hypothetical protein